MYYIFAFRHRGESLCLFEKAKQEGIVTRLINTPRCISIGCGLSVRVAESDFNKVESIYKRLCFKTFLGLFSYKEVSPIVSRNEITRVY